MPFFVSNAVLSPVRTLRAAKSAVGEDVRPLEIFDYGAVGGPPPPVLDPYTAPMWSTFATPGNLIDIQIFSNPTTILPGDQYEYRVNAGTWLTALATFPAPLGFTIGPIVPDGTYNIEIRYTRGPFFSPPSDVKVETTFG